MNDKNQNEINQLYSSIQKKYGQYKKLLERDEDGSAIIDEIWQLSKKKFKLHSQAKKGIEQYKGMIFTVGFSAEPIILNILATKPKAIFFIYTKESELTLDKISEQLKQEGSAYKLNSSKYKREIIKKDSFASSVDLIGIGLSYLHDEKGIALRNIGLDITGGTKVMSVACALAAFCFGPDSPDLFYISHKEYDEELRRPVFGTEQLKIIRNPLKACSILKEKGFNTDVDLMFK